jgi:uncharacterized protein (DUF58 family)
MKAGRASLTVRGRVVLGAAAALALGGWLFGVRELVAVALAALIATVVTRLWVDLTRWRLDVSRHVHPTRVTAGQEARVELAISNPGPHRSPPVEARDPFDGGRRWARFWVAPLAPREVRTSSYRLPSTRRGVYRLGPLELRLTDPLGLASTTRTTAADTSLTVHPVYEMVPMPGLSAHRDEDRRMAQPLIGKGGHEFYKLREYVPGDDLRHVHWPTTARVDDLVIRQPENLRRGRTTVVADLRASVHDEDSVERVLSAVASLAMSALASGLQVRVVTTAGFDSGHEAGRDHGPSLLDALAAAVTHRDRPGVAPFRLAGGLEPVVVVTTDGCDEADLHAAMQLSGTTGTTLVIMERATRTGPLASQPGETSALSPAVRRIRQRTVRVGRNDSFARAWSVQILAPVGS